MFTRRASALDADRAEALAELRIGDVVAVRLDPSKGRDAHVLALVRQRQALAARRLSRLDGARRFLGRLRAAMRGRITGGG